MKNHLLTPLTLGTLSLALASGCGASSDAGQTSTSAGGSSAGGDNNAGTSATTVAGGGDPANVGGNSSLSVGGASAGGNQGTGGTSVPSATGTLGLACSPVGTLACNGINQRLTLVCGASGKWETNQTCNVATQVCDPRPGSTQGTCQEQDPVCATQTPGVQYCEKFAEWACDAWVMKAGKVRDCPIGACFDGKCVEATGCSTAWNFLSCSSDCPSLLDPSTRCGSQGVDVSTPPTDGSSGSAIVHRSYADAVPPTGDVSSCPTRRFFNINPMGSRNAYVMVRVQSPWKVSWDFLLLGCAFDAPGTTCETVNTANDGITIYTDDPTAPAANVYIQASPTDQHECPANSN